MKKVYQYVKFSDFNAKKATVKITNTYAFTNLKDYVLAANVLVNGKSVETSQQPLAAILPGKSSVVALTLKGGYDAAAEVLVNLEVLRPEALYPVAAEQFTIQERQKTLPAVQVADTELKLISATQGTSRIVKNANFLIQFSQDGIIEKWQMKGIDVVKANGGPDYENYRWI